MIQAPKLAFVPISKRDEYLHPVAPDAHYTALETNLYGFNCPAAGLDGELYAWYHPALKVMGFMIYIYRGGKRHQLEAEYFNEYTYLPMIADNADYRLQMGSCGVHVKVVKPLEEIIIEIDDARRGLQLHLVTRGVFSPVGRPGGGHFTQLMENEGTLQLRGETYDIAGWFVRDRSWGQNRPEHIQPGPPANWMTGWFGRDLAFHMSVLDTSLLALPEYGPDWTKHFNVTEVEKSMKYESGGMTPDINLRGGWWYAGDRPLALESAEVTSTVYPGTVMPSGTQLKIRDVAGNVHEVKGETLSFIPKMHGQNVVCGICFTKWTCGDRVGYGELMAVYDNEHLIKAGWM
jgi:hypothetical protein